MEAPGGYSPSVDMWVRVRAILCGLAGGREVQGFRTSGCGGRGGLVDFGEKRVYAGSNRWPVLWGGVCGYGCVAEIRVWM